MANTPNFNLNLPDYGSGGWNIQLNDNFTILDTAIKEAMDRGYNIVVGAEAPLVPKYGMIWIDISEGSNTAGVIKGKYKVYNGTQFEEYKYITDASLVKLSPESLFVATDIEGALNELKANTDKIPILNTKVSPETPLNTTSQNLSGAVNELKSEITTISGKAGKIGTKDVDETDIADNYTLRYDGIKDKIVYVRSEIDRIPPAKVTNISVKEDNTKLTVTYTPPLDSDYMGTRLVYNTTANPTDINDGTVIANFISGTEIAGLVNDTKYFIRLFPYDMSGNYNIETGQSITATPTEMKIYGVKIEKANSNPETSVTYTDNAVGLTPMKSTSGVFNIGSWADKFPFNAIKPCLVKNGVVNYYLNPNDYTKKVTGGASDITTGADGDVMVEFPKIYWKFSEDSTHRLIQYSDKPFTGAKCLAHMRGVTEKDKCYISAYLGFETGGKLRSLSGKTPTVNKTIGAFRTIAQANGVGYDQMAYYQLLMLQVLYTVAFKNLDSQTALGRGYVDGNTAATTTGGTNTKGMFYGETTGKQQVKFCGIEDFYGNCFYWIDGFFCDASRNILIANQGFNDTGAGYTNYGQGATANLGGYISDIQGGTETGFVAKAVAGSATTYYADYGNLNADRLPYFGGYWGIASFAGAFCFNCNRAASNSGASYSSRLLACV